MEAELATLRKRVAELEQQVSELARFRELIEKAPFYLQIFDDQGFSLYMNEAVEAFLGLPDRSLTYGKFNILTDPTSARMGLLPYFQKAYTGEIVRIPEIAINLGNYSEDWESSEHASWMEELIYPIKDDAGEVRMVACFFWDITERKQVGQALVHAQKQEGLVLLTGGIAHDFNNLLTGIIGNTSLATQLSDASDSEVEQCLEESLAAAKQAGALTRQLLSYSGEVQVELQPLSLRKSILDTVKMLRLALPKGISVRTDLPEIDCIIRGDLVQIKQVIMNLITNAAEASYSPAEITVSIGERTFAEAESCGLYQSERLEPGRYVYFNVADQGAGMSGDTVSRMFDPFFTTKKKGHGLGLAAVRGIVKSHGGAIEVFSGLGRGTQMTVLLPAAEGEAPAPKSTAASISKVKPRTILVVEDEKAIRAFVRRSLEKALHRVIIARDGEEGVDKFERYITEIDLVLMDNHMPKLTGLQALKKIRQLKPELPVILMSGHFVDGPVKEALESGNTYFLQKPFGIAELKSAVWELLNKSQDKARY